MRKLYADAYAYGNLRTSVGGGDLLRKFYAMAESESVSVLSVGLQATFLVVLVWTTVCDQTYAFSNKTLVWSLSIQQKTSLKI